MPTDPNTIDLSAEVVGLVCSNQEWVSMLLSALMAHLAASGASAFLKKRGITTDSPIVGKLVMLIRLLALDVKPPAAPTPPAPKEPAP